jgi:hypothetical protein
MVVVPTGTSGGCPVVHVSNNKGQLAASRHQLSKAECLLSALKSSVAWYSAVSENQPTYLWSSGEESIEGKIERGLLMEVSNLIIKKKNWTG